MVEIISKYKIGERKFGLINWVGVWTLYKKEVLRFLIPSGAASSDTKIILLLEIPDFFKKTYGHKLEVVGKVFYFLREKPGKITKKLLKTWSDLVGVDIAKQIKSWDKKSKTGITPYKFSNDNSK